jgi:hypothetical protein
MRRSPALAVAALLLATGAAGCGGDDPDRLAAGDGFSVEAALAELPVPPDLAEDDPRGLTVVVADLEAAAGANEAGDRPDAGDDDLGEWLLTATGTAADEGDDGFPPVFVPPAEVLGADRLASVEDIEAELGWSVLDVDAVAEVVAPPFRFGVVTGAVGEDTFADAGLEPDDDGVVTVGEGDDLETDVDGATTARPLGSPLRMAADGDRLVASTSTDAVAEWRDGEPATLAEEDDLRAVAAVLDDAEVVSAYLTTAIPQQGDYTALGIGWAGEEGGSRIVLAYAYGSEAAAEEGAELVEAVFAADTAGSATPLSDLLELDEVEVDGTVVVAYVQPGPEGRPQIPVALLSQADVPFVLE